MPLPASKTARRPRRGALVLLVYVVVVVAAFASGRAWLEELAAFMLVSVLLWPALRRRSVVAGVVWTLAALAIAALALTGRGSLALDFMPVIVNGALSALFASTLAAGAEPLIARVIAVLESPERLQLPRVAEYARALTLAWAVLLGAQAIVLATLILCAVPDGLLASFGIAPPIAITGNAWRWYLHLGSYASVFAFLLVEYAFRRWYLRHIPHVALPTFVTRLVRRWPALARSVMHEPTARSDA